MEYNISMCVVRACFIIMLASSAVSPIACSGILAVLAIFSALIFPMPNVAAGVSAPIRALKSTRSGTIDVCTFTLFIMSITARFFTREHMQSWPFSCISSTKYRNRGAKRVMMRAKPCITWPWPAKFRLEPLVTSNGYITHSYASITKLDIDNNKWWLIWSTRWLIYLI